jgi:cyclic pyranopterin phosphate synthase
MVPLIDGHGRRVRDLRISVTDRCNLRCTYCMPAEGLAWLPRDEVLTYEELARVARICVERWAFDGIRITGGEPTLRADIESFVEMLATLGVDLAMTTNAIRLVDLAVPLRAAGLDRVNISLDTLRPETFRAITRRDDLDRTIAGIDAAISAGLDPVKINAVVMRGVNDDEVVDLAAFARDRGVGLRFIEFMPLDAEQGWTLDRVVPAREILERVHAAFPLATEPRAHAQHVEPAERFAYADGRGDVGVIASVTEPFCGDCDRVRITADGRLRTCLFALDEHDLRALLRGGADDDAIAGAIERAVGAKWAGHRVGNVDFIRPDRSMSQIGG